MKNQKTLRPGVASGIIGKYRIVHMTSGIGMANASHAVTVLLERYKPGAILLFGIGGAYPGCGLAIGDVVGAEKEIYADLGVLTKNGYKDMRSIGIPILLKNEKKYFNEFPAEKVILKKNRIPVKRGRFLTVSQSAGTPARARQLRDSFDAVCENMEGAAVAHICLLYGVQFSEIRGISNIAGDRDKRRWDIKKASENCQKAVIDVLRDKAHPPLFKR